MKKNVTNIWNVLYPIALYYLVSSFAFFAMNIFFGDTTELYMLKQMVSSGVTIPFLCSLWKQDRYIDDVVYGKEKQNAVQIVFQVVLTCIGMVCIGMAANNFIAMTPLMEVSTGFQTANENFFGGTMLLEILASCVVVPIAEELLFRGIVLKRVTMLTDVRWGVLISAVLFGVIHVNLVQFIYAVLLGLVLALVVVKTRKVSLAVWGHAAANLIAIVRAETGFLDFSYQAKLAGIVFSLVAVVVGVGAIWLLFKQSGEQS